MDPESHGWTAADADRLAKLLGMLGSDHAGERDAAAIAAVKFRKQRNVTWPDVIGAPAPQARPRQPQRPRHATPDPWPETPWSADWRAVAAGLGHYADLMSDWERDFVASIRRQKSITPKQHDVVLRLARRMGLVMDAAA